MPELQTFDFICVYWIYLVLNLIHPSPSSRVSLRGKQTYCIPSRLDFQYLFEPTTLLSKAVEMMPLWLLVDRISPQDANLAGLVIFC